MTEKAKGELQKTFFDQQMQLSKQKFDVSSGILRTLVVELPEDVRKGLISDGDYASMIAGQLNQGTANKLRPIPYPKSIWRNEPTLLDFSTSFDKWLKGDIEHKDMSRYWSQEMMQRGYEYKNGAYLHNSTPIPGQDNQDKSNDITKVRK